ncbi:MULTISPECIES: ArsJ-associated glyceraldehyde-3-phosphate dehydrogenase [Gammaproteobacteria]|uniref:ArsJ-associated glyceraldehyde-3-phosphate dehydrogenase n=1 Tax=Gammaproteobacteria TaxID=1236 RepID=UPI000DD03F79|nr:MULTISPECIES: ArsJ-associated glyceraldehyde-3-phosphate dehydrogenase [Gammaproteobacteria]RTE87757.1 glyceraldehyde-3-phosphate dehydrogenase [Aliidiomarina sp. B3213]TCZ92461.1 ArsJ-associated glyceraldehyde-3-phosphate dehydrogenase [Lysobacter sp. N42]
MSSQRNLKVGINGFGRIGRLAFRAAFDRADFNIVHVNDPGADATMLAHLLEFDSSHGRWHKSIQVDQEGFTVEGQSIRCTSERDILNTDWSDCDIVIEASGKNKTVEALEPYFDQGVDHVVVSAPVKSKQVPNVVVGVNDEEFDPLEHSIVSAASCTTNCLAPVVKVIQEGLGIKHASMTTIHALTNTQSILDAPHKDMRRARACGDSLIPTTTGSAKAITTIFPELEGRINGHAVRVPISCPSLTDVVFEVSRETDTKEVNRLLKSAAEGELEGILGFEEKPLVSIDYKSDPRSSIVDALSTMVINGTQVKIYAWYDNEFGYANRTVDLVERIVQSKKQRS